MMRELELPFEITYHGEQIRVSEHAIADKRIFRIDLLKPLTIDRAEKKFWTSILQVWQEEAEEIAKLLGS